MTDVILNKSHIQINPLVLSRYYNFEAIDIRIRDKEYSG